jgi:hypothetical protein
MDDHSTDRTGPWVADSVADLLAGAVDERDLRRDDGKSGSRFRQVTIDGQTHFVKSVSRATDWIMRVVGDTTIWPFQIWRAGVMALTPPEIDHTMVGMAVEGTGDDAVLTMLMRDVGDHLVPEGDDRVTGEMHAGFLDGLAALSAATWGWRDEIGLCTLEQRFRFFAPATIAPELARDWPDGPPGPLAAADEGWRRLAERAPELHRAATALHDDPTPLAAALRATPQCFLHGDWKMGNLGRHPDGRTILLDWAYPGAGPPCWDLAWYLSLNAARLPEPKEAAIDAFERALDRRGIATPSWFADQVALCLLADMVAFGWEKALGSDDELRWWVDAARSGAQLL